MKAGMTFHRVKRNVINMIGCDLASVKLNLLCVAKVCFRRGIPPSPKHRKVSLILLPECVPLLLTANNNQFLDWSAVLIYRDQAR
jgi:hypothetical protein